MRRLRDSTAVTAVVWLVVVAVVVATALRLTGLAAGVWPVASLTAFTLYLVPLAGLSALAALALARPGAAAVLAVCVAVVVVLVFPRARADDQPRASGQTVRVTTANLRLGQADPGSLAAVVRRRRPDVLALQEALPGTLTKLRDGGVFDDLPYVVSHASTGRGRDTVLASRWPLTRLDLAGVPSVFLVAQAKLPGGATLPLVSAHPLPPLRPGDQGQWESWLAALPGPRGPLAGGLVAGDFNATLDHPQLRDVLGRGWRDVADQLGQGLKPTWKGGASFTPTRSLRLTLDHVLIPPGAAVTAYEIDDVERTDHRAVTATVVLPSRR